MAVTRARVEMKNISPHASYAEREIAFKKMLTAFKKARSEAGIDHAYKQHEHHESKGVKKRRRRRELEVQMLKAKLKENFPERNKRD